ncbi:MAG: hypothetical protein ACYDAC_01585 [Candidatus Dormibacteria bacterium]
MSIAACGPRLTFEYVAKLPPVEPRQADVHLVVGGAQTGSIADQGGDCGVVPAGRGGASSEPVSVGADTSIFSLDLPSTLRGTDMVLFVSFPFTQPGRYAMGTATTGSHPLSFLQLSALLARAPGNQSAASDRLPLPPGISPSDISLHIGFFRLGDTSSPLSPDEMGQAEHQTWAVDSGSVSIAGDQNSGTLDLHLVPVSTAAGPGLFGIDYHRLSGTPLTISGSFRCVADVVG